MKRIITIFSVLVSVFTTAQQEPQFTQYLDNMLLYNPAYAGSRDMMSVNATTRNQWVGHDGAPRSHVFSLHTPLKYESIAVGFNFLNDVIGPIRQNWVNFDASYTLRFKNHSGKLAFALRAGMNFVNANLSQLSTTQVNDPTFAMNYQSSVLPNLGTGVYYYSKKYFVGISSPRLYQNSGNNILKFNDQRHLYFTGGGYIELNRMWKIRASTLVKLTVGAPAAIDLSSAFIYYDQIWLGVNYRVQDSFGFYIQYLMKNQFRIGYGYDLSTTSMIRTNKGTHEIVMNYDFYFKKGKVYSPRYF